MELQDGKFTLFQKDGQYGKYYTGKAEYMGQPVWVNVTKKGVTKDGTPMLCGNIKPRQPKTEQQEAQLSNGADYNPLEEAWNNA